MLAAPTNAVATTRKVRNLRGDMGFGRVLEAWGWGFGRVLEAWGWGLGGYLKPGDGVLGGYLKPLELLT